MQDQKTASKTDHKVVSREEWLKARKELLVKEKELSRAKDQLTKSRQDLPWVKIDKEYVFESSKGQVTLSDLFSGRSQLIVQHFMFSPEWEEGCVGCSFLADHKDAARQHINHHDISAIAISRAPVAKIEAFKKRMNWQFPWVSSANSDFNYDFGVSFRKEDLASGKVMYNYEEVPMEMEDMHGTSVFYKDEKGDIYHTYSTYARGDEQLIGAYSYIDMTPMGRAENDKGDLMDWVRHHDKYETKISF